MGASTVAGALALTVMVAIAISGSAQPSAATGAGSAASNKLGPQVAAMSAHRPSERVEVILRMSPGASTSAGRSLVKAAGGTVVSRDLPIINGFGAELRAGDVSRLASDPRVRAISLNGAVKKDGVDLEGELASVSDSTDGSTCPDADATSVPVSYPIPWRNNADTNISTATSYLSGAKHHSIWAEKAWDKATGKGVGVAVVDTGIAGELPDFRHGAFDSTSRVVASAVTNPCATDATDNFGHGTHVAGLIAGNSLALNEKDPAYGRHMGIAPEAHLINVKASDEDGRATVLDVIHGLQFVVDHKSEFNIRVVNLSLSSTVAESYRTDPLDAAVEQAWLNGIVVVAAAGNAGTAPDAVSYAPGNDPHVISVGAADDRGTRDVGDDRLAEWSSRGLTQDEHRKPEVLAPGAHLVSTIPPKSDLATMCTACLTGGRYFRMGGTSMSAAVLSGVVALMLERRPGWTPDQVKGALQSTLVDVPGMGGEVNAWAAMAATRLGSNTGLLANDLIDTDSGAIDWTRASFRRASFRDASGSPLDASFSRASFRCDCSLLSGGAIDPTRASFRRASFRKTADFEK